MTLTGNGILKGEIPILIGTGYEPQKRERGISTNITEELPRPPPPAYSQLSTRAPSLETRERIFTLQTFSTVNMY